MTTTQSKALFEYLHGHSFVYLTTTASIVAVLLLLAVAVEREILRTIKPEVARRNVATFAVVVMPTLFIFAVVVVTRFVRLS